MTLAAVNIVGAERANPDFIRAAFGLEAGDTVDNRKIGDRATAVYALSDFERVAYTLTGDGEQPTLNLHLTEKSWGPNILRFDLGFHIGTDANTAFMIGGDYLRTWVNDLGGEIHGSWRFGRTSGLDASLYQPLDDGHRWFVEPRASAQRSIEDIFIDGDAVARYRFSHAWGSLDTGRVFGNRAELRAGIRSGGQTVEREIGDAGPARDLERGLRRPDPALLLRHARPQRALAERHAGARGRISAASKRSARWSPTTGSRAWP